MQGLELDFHGRRRSPRWVGRVLFIAALAFAADVTSAYVHVSAAVRAGEAQLAHRSPRKGAMQPVSPEELRAARQTLDRLSLAWDNLFDALEQNPVADVALLAIEPDVRSGTALISGEAKDYASVLNYVAKLGAAKNLSDVYLVRHELHPESRRPVQFSLSAAWKERS